MLYTPRQYSLDATENDDKIQSRHEVVYATHYDEKKLIFFSLSISRSSNNNIKSLQYILAVRMQAHIDIDA